MADILPIVEVTELPEQGEFGINYRLDMGEEGMLDYVWNGTDYTCMPFDTDSMSALFGSLVDKVVELEEAVFPIEQTSFEMMITSLMAVELDLYDENDEIVPNMGLSTEYWEEPFELVYQNEVRKGTYYLKNSDGYALGKPNGEIQPLVCEGGTVDLGNVEVIQITQKKGGK